MAYYPKYTGSTTSIVNALAAIGVNSSYENRKQIAAANGMSDYSGTAAQNTRLLNLLKQGMLVKPGSGSVLQIYPQQSSEVVDAMKTNPVTVPAQSNYVELPKSSGSSSTSAGSKQVFPAVKSESSASSITSINNSKQKSSMFDNLTDKQKKALKIGAVVVGVSLVGYGVYKATRKSSAGSVSSGGKRKVKAALGGVSRRKKRKGAHKRRTRKVNLV